MNRRKFLNQVAASTMAATFIHIPESTASSSLNNKSEIKNKKLVRPKTNNDICFLSLHEQVQLIRTKKMSSLELTTIYFQRIKTLETDAASDRKLNCFITLNEENALSKARELDALAAQNKWQGPLHGALISIKDDIEVAGMPMTAGSKLLQNWKPTKDAFCITRLKNNGAVISGKTNLEEFTFGALGENLFYGNIKNPFNLKYSSGGSSSGSAASVAAGLCSASIGSDAAGSVRIPSAACGLYGFKPTLGMISRNGLTPFIPTKDAIGCIARSALDIKILFQSMCGYDINDPLTYLVPKNINSNSDFLIKKNFKIGCLTNILKPMNTELVSAFNKSVQTLKSLNLAIEDVDIPNVKQIYTVGKTINLVEERTSIELLINKVHPELEFEKAIKEMQVQIQNRLGLADKISASTYCSAVIYKKNEINKIVQSLFQKVDFIVLPTLGEFPPLLEGLGLKSNKFSLELELFKFPSELAGLLGLPAITVPQGIGTDGLPIGFQIIGRPFKDNQLLDFAIFLEKKIGEYQRPQPTMNS